MPRCKNCKEKFDAKHFNQKFCFRSACVKVWVETAKVKNWKKTKKEWKQKNESISSLMKKAQKVFNAYIRKRDHGRECASCDTILTTEYDAGHYFSSGGFKSVTYNEANCWGQCRKCNHFLSGNLIEYQIKIQQRIGADHLLELYTEAHKEKKYTRDELNEIVEKYKKKIKEL